jgi:hypothetical protein
MASLGRYVTDFLAVEIKPLAPATDVNIAANASSYSVPIWLSGVLSFLDHNRVDPESLLAETTTALKDSIGSITQHLTQQGSLHKVLKGIPSASSYLTYWGVSTLLLSVRVFGRSPEVDLALEKVAGWAEGEITRLISCHHASISQRFDVVECLAASSIAFLLSGQPNGLAMDDMVELALHAAAVTLDSYFQDGSFRLSRPVFSRAQTDQQYTVLCPTSEVLMMLLSSMESAQRMRLIDEGRLEKLTATLEWCRRNRRKSGFPPDYDASLSGEPEINAFSTSSTLSFMSLLHAHLDDSADNAARSALRIGTEPPEEDVHDYPDAKLAAALEAKIVGPLALHTGRKPSYSIILHGPPGTAKTSIAAKLAHDLRWPLKTITQSDFLKSGEDKIDAEADKIFTLCLSLKDVVLLFDELEELILARDVTDSEEAGTGRHHESERGSRLLTTSMLPKIHHLRDRKRVVFILATNRLVKIDPAATRLGRFDMIKWVGYPTTELLTVTLNRVVQRTQKNNPSAYAIADSVANGWVDLAPTDASLTFVEMEHCADALVNCAIDGATEATCKDKLKAGITSFSGRNTETLKRYKDVADYDRI